MLPAKEPRMMCAANSGNRQALHPGLPMPSSCYFYPNRLPALLAHLPTVQPSVPSSEQTTNLEVHWIPKKGPECSLAELYSDERLPFHPILWLALWSMGLPESQGREDGRGWPCSAKGLGNLAFYLLGESSIGTGPSISLKGIYFKQLLCVNHASTNASLSCRMHVGKKPGPSQCLIGNVQGSLRPQTK